MKPLARVARPLMGAIALGVLVVAPSVVMAVGSPPVPGKHAETSKIIYSLPFAYIGEKKDNRLAELSRTGHVQLLWEISHQTSNLDPPLSYKLSNIDVTGIASLIEELQSLNDLPRDQKLELAAICPNFVIIPKYWTSSFLATVHVAIAPFPDGIMKIGVQEHFKPEDQLSGIGRLARRVAREVYRAENITVAAFEKKQFTVGFRKFLSHGDKADETDYSEIIPLLLESCMCSKSPPEHIVVKSFRPTQNDSGLSSQEYAKMNNLDFLVEGYIAHLSDQLFIGTSVVNRTGEKLIAFAPVPIQSNEVVSSKFSEFSDTAAKIMKFLCDRCKNQSTPRSPKP